jgi:DNA cross-link repair 1A protein
MFRNPRDNVCRPHDQKLPHSIGRPPSPPSTFVPTVSPIGTPKAMSTKAKATPSKPSRLPATPKVQKAKTQANGNIIAFFKKAEELSQALFVPERYNESGGVSKRRKTEEYDTNVEEITGSLAETACTPPPQDDTPPAVEEQMPQKPAAEVPKRNGPFLEDSESEDEEHSLNRPAPKFVTEPLSEVVEQKPLVSLDGTVPLNAEVTERVPTHPLLKREATSYSAVGDFEGFENLEDFEDEEFEDGEEFQERRWMAEQSRVEMEDDGGFEGEVGELDAESYEEMSMEQSDAEAVAPEPLDAPNAPKCPICSIALVGVTDEQASVHVNNCLDGNPTPLPVQEQATAKKNTWTVRPAKPAQKNPFTLASSKKTPSTAFTKLMSGHTEEIAWKKAAAAEVSSRGKPSYTRTCPFYKILPGMSICVDAFRYGAVEGCQGYFLSHFHSDHYIGLTSSWHHGTIYCSRITGNLVRQQLRVDPKWVVDLEFEKEVEVPNTDGVRVTMISANHCPGSSLFLFQKVTGYGKNPKVQRVLHCGDFRACRAHLEHPLLRPDVADIVTGKTKEQKIDVCYLDTTYLNPKYAFPCQEDVITACADMCVSLNNAKPDEQDKWETMKRERAGSGMTQFLSNGTTAIKTEDQDPTDGRPPTSPRGKLLVVVGTYSIGKERVCLGIARALKSKIYAPPGKQRICACLEDPELNALLTTDPREAQVHMTPLFEIRADTLDDYLKDYHSTFTRAVGFRPSGWNYRPPNSRFVESPSVQTVLYGSNWKSGYSMKDLIPQRGSTKRAACFGVPYSEHSSFRELTMFCCALRIERIIPTVNVGSAKGREKMRGWCEKWAQERKKSGLFQAELF